MILMFTQGHNVTGKLRTCAVIFVVKSHEATQRFVAVYHVREMTVEKSCKCNADQKKQKQKQLLRLTLTILPSAMLTKTNKQTNNLRLMLTNVLRDCRACLEY